MVDSHSQYGILQLCLSGQASAHAISTGWLPASSKPPQRASSLPAISRARTLPPSCLGGLAAKRGVRPGRKSFRQNDDVKSLGTPLKPAGALPAKISNGICRMTAEIAVLNRSAVALAADSAVTVGPPDAPKTFDTVNKLFTLSKYHPVGIMIHGGADHMRIPWEVIIKMYRESRGHRSKPHIGDYGQDFIRFLQRNLPCPEIEQKQNVESILSRYFKRLYKELTNEVKTELMKGTDLKDVNVTQIVSSILDGWIKGLRGLKRLPFLTGVSMSVILRKYINEFETAKKKELSILGPDKGLDTKLKSFAGQVLAKDIFSPNRTGIVIAGFGEDEWFPSLVEYYTDGVIYGKLKYKKKRDTDISRDLQASVHAFAQSEMVQRFMQGVDPDYDKYLRGAIASLMREYGGEIIEGHITATKRKKAKIKEKLYNAIGGNIEDFFKKARNFQKERFADEITETIKFLPKEELANMAEALVNLTSLKRRISFEAETVGGPIDVALISKGDGFIWIKRKHYFSPELNQHFLANYFRKRMSPRIGR